MKKLLLCLALALLAGFSFLILKPNSRHFRHPENEKETEREDGILMTQQQEFEITKDVSLGYIPKYRLVNAYENSLLQKQMRTNSTSGVEVLSWSERGSYWEGVQDVPTSRHTVLDQHWLHYSNTARLLVTNLPGRQYGRFRSVRCECTEIAR